MPEEETKRKKAKPETLDIKEYLEQLPPPPEEHSHELKMEKHLKRMLLEQEEKLSEEELQFYSRQIVLDEIGLRGQQRLKRAKVCIVGLGGLGCTIAIQLAAMGVGHLRLVDRDVVEESNLQRQHLYNFDLIGFPKVEAAVKRLERLNPYVQFEPLPLSLNADNADAIIRGMNVVVDGLDNMNTRYAVNRACVRLGVPYVFGAAISTYGNTSTIIPNETACLECFYGKLDDSHLRTCATVGVHPSVLGVVASIEVAETIKILLGRQPTLTNKLLYCDVRSLRFEEIDVTRMESCPVCGSQPRTDPMPLKNPLIEEGCGRRNKRVFTIIPKENLKLEMQELASISKKSGARLNVEAKLGVTFATNERLLVSLLSSGVMVVEGASSEEEALEVYRRIVVDRMRVSWSRISRRADTASSPQQS